MSVSRTALGTLAAASLTGLVAGTALADASYTRTTVDNAIPGAAFVVAGNIMDNPRPEIVVAAFGQIGFGPSGPVYPAAGTVSVYRNAQPGNAPNGQIALWNRTEVVGLADAITFPNRPLLADINEDGRNDLIVPGGFFWDAAFGNSRGSLTWWENAGNGQQWIRHDIVTGSLAVFHSVVYDDFDGDTVADIMTVSEAAGLPSSITDDVIELMILRGNGDGTFQPPVKVADGGGSLIESWDVNGDGYLDIVSAQYFGPVLGQPFVPLAARNASNASFVWFENDGQGNFTRHAIGVNQGPSFNIVPVRNLLGDGVTRWIATNHTNLNIASPPFSLYPEPAVYEFTPGPDPRQLWSVRQLSSPGSFPVTGGQGQASPGAVAAGDLDGDGRLDIAVSGDGSRAVYWLEQQEDGSFVTRQFPDSTGYGQAGGPVVMDINRSGTNEVIFSSFDQNTLAIWSR